MPDYDINIHRLLKEGKDGTIKTEIWAETTQEDSGQKINKLIWWEDDDGVFHDGTMDLPVSLRELVDNAWIEQIRKW